MARPRKLKPPKQHARSWGDGSVRQVREGVWRAFRARVHRPDGSTTRPSRTFSGPHAAQQAAVWAKGEPEQAVLLLGLWLDRWLALRQPTIAASTYRSYRRNILQCAPLARRPLAEITAEEWQQLTNALIASYARSSVQVWRVNVASALRAAIPRYLAVNPMERVKLPKRQERTPRAWTQAEIDRLLSAAAGRTHEPWLLFSLGTGVRIGESRALLWADVDLISATATIRASLGNTTNERGPTKSRRLRTVDIPDEVVPVLAALRKRQPAGQLLVFGHGSEPYRTPTYRSWLRTICKHAGVTPYPPHALRHTFASLALDADPPVPIQDISRALGHSSISTTQDVYSHYLGDGLRRAAKAIGAALRNRFSGPKRSTRSTQ